LRRKCIYAAWLTLQLLLIIAFSCRDTLRVLAEGPTILPGSFSTVADKAETVLSTTLGQKLPASSPLRQALATYLHVAGIEAGYNYFAPNVPGGYKLVFEVHYHDGRVEYELPSVTTAAAGLRMAGLLDNIGRIRCDAVREILVKTLAQPIWREHTDVESVRAILGSVTLPSVRQFEKGTRESYEFLYAYDFSLTNQPAKPHDQ
jgi:hypothetical protein